MLANMYKLEFNLVSQNLKDWFLIFEEKSRKLMCYPRVWDEERKIECLPGISFTAFPGMKAEPVTQNPKVTYTEMKSTAFEFELLFQKNNALLGVKSSSARKVKHVLISDSERSESSSDEESKACVVGFKNGKHGNKFGHEADQRSGNTSRSSKMKRVVVPMDILPAQWNKFQISRFLSLLDRYFTPL